MDQQTAQAEEYGAPGSADGKSELSGGGDGSTNPDSFHRALLDQESDGEKTALKEHRRHRPQGEEEDNNDDDTGSEDSTSRDSSTLL